MMQRLSALALALMMCLGFFGCARDEVPEESAPAESIATPAPEPAAGSALNPVSIFYSEYYSNCQQPLTMLQRRLGMEPSASSANSLIYLADHNLRVAEGHATFGRLLSTDLAGSFASSVSGAAVGSGTINLSSADYDPELLATAPTPTPDAEDDEGGEEEEEQEGAPGEPSMLEDMMAPPPEISAITPEPSPTPESSHTPEPAAADSLYLLQFSYSSGKYIYGTLQGNHLSYRSDSDGAESSLLLEDGVWVSTVSRQDGVTTALSCGENGARFSVSRPGAEGAEAVIHAWVCDRSGLKYVEGQGLA